MREMSRAVAAALVGLTLTAALTGCNDSGSGKGPADSASSSSDGKGKTTYRLGEASPPQESTMQTSKGAAFTVTPTKVTTGSKADMDKSGLQRGKNDDPKIPVYVWATFAHKSGKTMAVGDMDDGLIIRTDKDQRTRALIVLMGQAKWPDCPAFDRDKQLHAGQSENICQVFLIPEGQKAAAVELSQGFTSEPLQWPVKD